VTKNPKSATILIWTAKKQFIRTETNLKGTYMQVIFSAHAAQRMQQRLNLPVNPGTKVDINSAFKLHKKYIHLDGTLVESWYCTIPGTRVVMVVSCDTQEVITVMTQGPVVDAVYYQAGH
jgi:hypothetical protein